MRGKPETGKPGVPRPEADKPEPAARHVYGPRPVGALIPAVTRPAFRRRNPATAQVLSDWEAIVGPTLAATSTPRRLSGGALTLACMGPAALELQHMSEALVARINAHFGQTVVERIRFVQVAPPPARPAPKPRPPRPAREPVLTDVPPGPLHDALMALGRAVLTRR